MTTDITRGQFLAGAGAAAAAGALPAAAEAAQATARAAGVTPAASGIPVPRNRQIHLDFHTSGLIEGIGTRFDAAQFKAALQAGRVNHINVFAKCHMSWNYYPTKLGKVHPHLNFDLLGAQLAACREIDVRAPVYLTVGWSERDAEEHPEWVARTADGSMFVQNGPWQEPSNAAKPTFQWKFLCAASSGPYHPTVMAQVEEIATAYPVDGFWLDIYHLANEGCWCDPCKARMRREGVNLADKAAVITSTARAIKDHMHQVRALVTRLRPNATVYFNPAPHVGNFAMFKERLFDENTQQEIEDLPTVWGGYDKLPIESKFHLGEGSRSVAMSGKFHRAWGEFGGFKAPAALRYEAAAMTAYGVACNFGDQLHPSGLMDPATYRNIGEAFSYVEKIEQYGPGGTPYARTGLWLTLDDTADRAASGMLLEMHHDYIIATRANLDSLSMLVVGSNPISDPADVARIAAWAARGGKLVLIGAGGLDPAMRRLVFDAGADYVGPAAYDVDYTIVDPAIATGMVATPFLNYMPAMRTRVTGGTVLARLHEPYFSRTYAHYNGHANTPYRLETAAHPAVVRKGSIALIAHPLDRLYASNGMKLHRDLLRNVIGSLGPSNAMEVEGLPSTGRVSLLHQPQNRRYIAHLLYGPALQRGDVQVIEDLPTIGAARLTMRLPQRIRSASAEPEGRRLSLAGGGGGNGDGGVRIAVPPFAMHTAIVLNY